MPAFFQYKWSGWLWLLVRLWLAWQWIAAAVEKLSSDAWVGMHAGSALTDFIYGALSKTGGAHPDVQEWYAIFLRSIVLPHVVQFSYIVTFGELLVGLALLAGLFTGTAAFFGALINLSYLAAGSVSINPYMLVLELLLIGAGRIAGYIGLDQYIDYLIGTPDKKGELFLQNSKGKWHVFGRELREE